MCSAAIFYTGVGRAVYGLSAGAILHLRNAQPHTAGLSLSCRAVLDSALPAAKLTVLARASKGAVKPCVIFCNHRRLFIDHS
jgi:hypothetical protein